MWIYTTIGFFSVVEDRKDKKKLCVRSRHGGDLDAFRKRYCPSLGPTTVSKGHSDYAARAFAGKRAFANAMFRIAGDIDYTNYKSRVMKTQGWDREGIYMRVWGVMKDAQASGRFDRLGTPAPSFPITDKGELHAGHQVSPRSSRNSLFGYEWEGAALRSVFSDDDELPGADDLPPGVSEENVADPFYWNDGHQSSNDPLVEDPDLPDLEDIDFEPDTEDDIIATLDLPNNKRRRRHR